MKKYFLFLVLVFAIALFSNSAQAVNQASFKFTPASGTYQAGQDFPVDIQLNTDGSQVVAVHAYVLYDKTKLTAVSIATSTSAFAYEVENTIDSVNGKIFITRGQPTPGVTGTTAQVARINFQALTAVNPTDVSFYFISAGASGDSGAILNDGFGTDILTSVTNASFNITIAADIIAPSIPLGVSAIATTNSATISWTASTDNIGVVGYGVYRNNIAIASSTQAIYTDSGLTPATTYSYFIDAYDAAGNTSAKSTTISVLTQSAADITPPVISSTQASTATNMATVSWTTDELADSQVEYGITSSYGLTTALDNALTFSHSQVLSGLTPNTTYNYRVISKDQAGNSAMSSNYTLATAAIADTTPPASISNLGISDISQTSVKLSWTVPFDASGVSIYDIRYSAANITSSNFLSAAQVSSIPTPAQSGTIQQHYISVGLTPGTTYYFAIISKDSLGNTAQISNIPSATTLPAPPVSGGGGGNNYQISDTIPPNSPSDIKATAFDTQVVLSWTNPKDPDFVRVKILRKTGSDPSSSSDGAVIYEGEGKTFTDTKLQNDTKYYYAIYAHDKVPNFSSPARISATPKAPVVTTSISTSTVPSLPSVHSTPKLPAGVNEGDLIRGPDGIKVYIVNQHGYRRHIFNPAIFNMYGHFKWDQIKTLDQKTLDSLPASDFYRADKDPRVFSLKEIDEKEGKAEKRWLNIQGEKFTTLGYKWEQVFIINEKERDYYQEGTPIGEQELQEKNYGGSTSIVMIPPYSLVKTENSPTIYFITKQGIKKPILNEQVFNSYPQNNWNNIITTTEEVLKQYPTAITVRLQGDVKIYMIDFNNKTKKWIKTMEAFNKLGFSLDEVIDVNQIEFSAYTDTGLVE